MKNSQGKNKRGARTVGVDENHDGQRLDNFIASELPGIPRSLVYRLIRTGQVRINGGRAKPAVRLCRGDQVRVPPAHVSDSKPGDVPDAALQAVRKAIVAEHDDYLVINKESGMAVHGGSGLAWGLIDALRKCYPEESPELVHRLDRETSGCLLVARNLKTLRELRRQFAKHSVDKRYLCLLDGRFREDKWVVNEPLEAIERGGERMMAVGEQGKPAQTTFSLLGHYGDYSYVEAMPLTGRTHQIRVHAAHLGLPLAGDSKYASNAQCRRARKLGLRRLFLHAHALGFEHPPGETQQFGIPLPDDLRSFLDRLAA
ncbi:MAG: RluA family pseudouridine synthase [Gammaproteobacteria bacterium]|nr:RluA family pseudouridine synthase [Gammaproteobacteria bacterium]